MLFGMNIVINKRNWQQFIWNRRFEILLYIVKGYKFDMFHWRQTIYYIGIIIKYKEHIIRKWRLSHWDISQFQNIELLTVLFLFYSEVFFQHVPREQIIHGVWDGYQRQSGWYNVLIWYEIWKEIHRETEFLKNFQRIVIQYIHKKKKEKNTIYIKINVGAWMLHMRFENRIVNNCFCVQTTRDTTSMVFHDDVIKWNHFPCCH